MAKDSDKVVSYPYIKNMVGLHVDDESMNAVPHAKGELYCHVTTKFAEAGSILGTIIGGGIGAVKSHMTLAGGAASGCRNGMLVGIPLGLFATYMAMRNVEKSGKVDMDYAYYDRSYRLRHNKNQVRVDRAAYSGLGIGTVAAVAMAANPLTGAAVGLASGTAAGGVYNMMISK